MPNPFPAPEAFAAAIEQELHTLGEPYSPAELREFVRDYWSLIQEEPALTRWTRAFLDEMHASGEDLEPEPESSSGEHLAERPTRGLTWIAGLAALGLVLGALVGAGWYLKDSGARGGVQNAALTGLWHGALTGLGAGLVVGAIIWAFFPYRQVPPRQERENRESRS